MYTYIHTYIFLNLETMIASRHTQIIVMEGRSWQEPVQLATRDTRRNLWRWTTWWYDWSLGTVRLLFPWIYIYIYVCVCICVCVYNMYAHMHFDHYFDYLVQINYIYIHTYIHICVYVILNLRLRRWRHQLRMTRLKPQKLPQRKRKARCDPIEGLSRRAIVPGQEKPGSYAFFFCIHIYLFIYLFVYLFIYLFVCLLLMDWLIDWLVDILCVVLQREVFAVTVESHSD
jgi:hypothetical protein